MMSMNSPRVSTVNGKVRNIRIGRSIEFKTPRSRAASINVNGLSAWTHGDMSFTTMNIAAAVISVLNKNRFNFLPFANNIGRN